MNMVAGDGEGRREDWNFRRFSLYVVIGPSSGGGGMIYTWPVPGPTKFVEKIFESMSHGGKSAL